MYDTLCDVCFLLYLHSHQIVFTYQAKTTHVNAIGSCSCIITVLLLLLLWIKSIFDSVFFCSFVPFCLFVLAQLTRYKINERENPKISLACTCNCATHAGVLLSSAATNRTAFFYFIQHYDWPFNVMAYTYFSFLLSLHLVNLFRHSKFLQSKNQSSKELFRGQIHNQFGTHSLIYLFIFILMFFSFFVGLSVRSTFI